MTPSMAHPPRKFVNAPGTFDPKMEPRHYESQMGGMMVMHRMMMKEGVNAKGITRVADFQEMTPSKNWIFKSEHELSTSEHRLSTSKHRLSTSEHEQARANSEIF